MPNFSSYSAPLTLASHGGTSPSISPPQSRLDYYDEFQSNAKAEPASPGSDSFLTGLGIAYHRNHEKQGLTKLELDDARCSPLGDPPFQTLYRLNNLQVQRDDQYFDDEFNCLYQREHSPLWSPPYSVSRLASESADGLISNKKSMLDSSDSKNAAGTSFSSIAAASRVSTGLLAEHLSATANLALRYMQSGVDYVFPSFDSSLDEAVEDPPSPWLVWPEYDCDIISRTGDSIITRTESPPSVDPAQIEAESPSKPEGRPVVLSYPSTTSFGSFHRTNDECMSGTTRPRTLSPAQSVDGSGDYRESERERTDSDASPFPSPRIKKRTQPRKKQSLREVKLLGKPMAGNLVYRPVSASEEEPTSRDINLGTPVLNAHKGINIEELAAKAERYRLRNPGRMFDNSWLVSFAGKLSSRGELVKEFRCYISGCSQTNKRRDHILIHVGSHLGQRPFACAFCPSQFFRKNECKRHELSHSGLKPFVCTICPNTAFVRQDLLKRHTARAHGIVTARKRKLDKENQENVDYCTPKRMKKEKYV